VHAGNAVGMRHVLRGGIRNVGNILLGKYVEKNGHLKNKEVDERIIFKMGLWKMS
jgi:hypothetical protein